jgi:catechol-2,3-dioxygenase
VDTVSLTMTRVILYVRDVERLKSFYRTHFGLSVTEEVRCEWAVLTAGAVELAVHRVGRTVPPQCDRRDAGSRGD